MGLTPGLLVKRPLMLALVFGCIVSLRARPHPVPFGRAADLFFAANAPWLVWFIGRHSYRSATMGSTLVARRAGI